MDDPHLVAVENRLQDLLDAVTVANSRRVSEGALGGGLCRSGRLCGTGVAGKQRIEMLPAIQERRRPLEGRPPAGQHKAGPSPPPAPHLLL